MIPIDVRDLVEATLADATNAHFYHEYARLSKAQAALLHINTSVDLTGTPRIIDSSGIRHALRQHGNESTETKHGQRAITPADFERIPEVVAHPDEVSFLGDNALRQPVFLFTKRIEHLYFVAEAVRFSKKGSKLVFQTMYKRK